MTLEFCCANKYSSGGKSATGTQYVWVGMLRRCLPGSDPEKKHRARVVFLQEGNYVVSACAKISNSLNSVGEDEEPLFAETWWAPLAENVQVGLLQQ